MRCFIARATDADPFFQPDSPDAIAVIAQRLDGIPLAIELAAARVQGLGVAELAAHLVDRFEVDAGRRGGPARQKTMRATLDWSFELLGEHERAMFRRLAVFRGRFELEAVEQTVPDSVEGAAATLASLVDKSMVVADSAPPARYRMLEPVREYAAELLTAAGGTAEAAARHADYYTSLAEVLDVESQGRNEISAGRRLDAARENLRAAFETAIERGDVSAALSIPVRLRRYARTHIWSEPSAWSVAALELPGAGDHPLRHSALLAAADGEWQRARHERALELAREVADGAEPGTELWRNAMVQTAMALVFLRRFEEAEAAGTAAVVGQSGALTSDALSRLSSLVLIRNAVGRPDATMARQLLDDATEYGNPTSLALALHTAGVVFGREDVALGIELQRRAAQTASASGATLIEGFALGTLAATTADDDPVAGARASVDVMKHYLRVGNRTHFQMYARSMLRPLVKLELYEAVATVDGATEDEPELGALATARTIDTSAAQASLGAGYATSAARGRGMTHDELVSYLEHTIAVSFPTT